jgi:hypothetical protein
MDCSMKTPYCSHQGLVEAELGDDPGPLQTGRLGLTRSSTGSPIGINADANQQGLTMRTAKALRTVGGSKDGQ